MAHTSTTAVFVAVLATGCLFTAASADTQGNPPNNAPLTEIYELQNRCGHDAALFFNKVFDHIGYTKLGNGEFRFASFKSHYNRLHNHCYILTIASQSKYPNFLELDLPTLGMWSYVINISDNEYVGEFRSIMGTKDALTPYKCHVFSKQCSSEREWDALTEPYLKQ
jgi:hypothetical protein